MNFPAYLALSLTGASNPCPPPAAALGSVDVAITGAFLEPDDLEVTAGDNVTIEYSVFGSGGELEDIPVGYFLSTDAVFDSSDILLDTDEVDVEDGELEDESEQIPIPASTAPGCYFVLVAVDYTDIYAEPDETNNVAASSIAVDVSQSSCSGATANLTPASASLATPAISLGESVASNVDLRNGGNASASSVGFSWFLSPDSVYSGSAGDVLLNSTQIGTLPPSTEQALPALLSPAATTAPGRYFVFFSADPNDTISESNEGDNVRSRRLVISDPAVGYYGFDAAGPNVGELTSIATPSAASPFEVNVRGIDNGGSGVLFASFNRVSAPRFGGTILVDFATTVIFQPFSLTQGRATIQFDLPTGMGGSTLYVQAAARDFSQTQNVALSNGMSVLLP